MTHSDYELLLHICYHALRKGHGLNMDQISDIDKMIKKLHREKHTRDRLNANLRNKKVGKRKGLHSS
jgi:hypothetical protein